MPEDEKEAGRVYRVDARYWLSVDRKLYRRSFGARIFYVCDLTKSMSS